MTGIHQEEKIQQLEARLKEIVEQLGALRTSSSSREEYRIEDKECYQPPPPAAHKPPQSNFAGDHMTMQHHVSKYHPPSTPWKTFEFDVFLSFSGEDTRKGFTSHLHYALEQAGVRTFFDKEGLEGGDIISMRLQNAIEGSAIAIPIFSRSYADSRWCLIELAKIVECNRSILPIFYDVDPSSVRKQKGAYETAFKRHVTTFDAHTVEGWRKALRTAGERRGYSLQTDEDGIESKVIQLVVGKVQDEVHRIRQLPLELPTPEMWGTEAMAYQKQIMNLLEDPNVHKIGVWGMGLVGKTAIVQHVHNQLLQNASNHEFDLILFVQVPYETTVKQIRDEIKRQVCPRASLADIGGNESSMLIKTRLEATKFLLILDDLWKGVDLQSLGVPDPNSGNGCKLLLTTRNLEVCDSMGTQADVKVMPLPPVEAWDYFCERVGGIPESVCDCIAKEIVESCGGLPGGLLVAAEHIRNAHRSDHDLVSVWTKARDALRSSKPLNQEMKERVLDRLRLSYDRLDSWCLRDVFMASAFTIPRYGPLFTTDPVLRRTVLKFYLHLEGLDSEKLEDENPSILPLFLDEVDHRIDQLVKMCMLEEDLENGAQVVRINELMRRMAFQWKGDQWVISDHRRRKDPPRLQEWEKAERVSFIGTSITTLPPKPRCPHLFNLALKNCLFSRIPDTFFEEMKRLRILSLAGTPITNLPMSLSSLVHLYYLNLSYCRLLKSIEGVLGGLKMLAFLFLNGTAIECLPSDMSELSKLSYLHLSDTAHLTRIPRRLMPQLCSLEILYMKGSAYVWSSRSMESARLQELQRMPRLRCGELVVATKEDLEQIKHLDKSLTCYVQESKETVEMRN